MKNSIVSKKDLISFIKKLLFCLFLISMITTISLAKNEVNINPGSIKIEINGYSDEIYANHNLTVKQKHKKGRDIFYQLSDYYLEGVNLAEYIMVKTPYASHYQSLDQPVLFLDKEDELSEVTIKMRLDQNIWDAFSRFSKKEKYSLVLFSDKGQDVKIDLHLDIKNTFIVNPGEIAITADNGPGFYQAEDYVTISINRGNSNWNLLIEAEPLVYQGNGADGSSQINPDDIYISHNNSNNFLSLETPYLINGYNYGNKTDIDLYLGTEVKWEHIAGNYTGQVIITISE
ncbi:MAG: hypothetical protein ACOCRU_00375 [bacterium]